MRALRLRNDVQLRIPGGPLLRLHLASTQAEKATGLHGRHEFPHELRGVLFPLAPAPMGPCVWHFLMAQVPFDILLVGLSPLAGFQRVVSVQHMSANGAGGTVAQDARARRHGYALEVHPGWHDAFTRAQMRNDPLALAGAPF